MQRPRTGLKFRLWKGSWLLQKHWHFLSHPRYQSELLSVEKRNVAYPRGCYSHLVIFGAVLGHTVSL